MRPPLGLGIALLQPRAAASTPLGAVRLRSMHTQLHSPSSTLVARCHRPLPPRLPSPSLSLQLRALHPSPPRHDIFFASIPAIKTGLLNVTRFSLLLLPFVVRYKLWKKYRRTSLLLLQIPIFAVCIVIALGLDQCPRTGRWRLMLMSEREEMAWSHRKHKEVLLNDGPLLLAPDDPRSIKAGRVATRLVCALEEQENNVVSGAEWPPKEYKMRFSNTDDDRIRRYGPSAFAKSGLMPFRPLSQNPLKEHNIENVDWNIYVLDNPSQLNAFALPSKDLFIYTGLLNLLPDDDTMLAAVLSHEIAHVTQRHSVENAGKTVLQRSYQFLNLAAVAFDVLRGISFALTVSFPFVTDSAGMLLNWLSDTVAERAYSRKLEEEADAIGLELMACSGYDPRGALDLWELFQCVEEDAASKGQPFAESRLAFLRSHPSSTERHEAITRRMPQALALWHKYRSLAPRVPLSKQVEEIQSQLRALDVDQSCHPVSTAEV